jgi:hypothetical protein
VQTVSPRQAKLRGYGIQVRATTVSANTKGAPVSTKVWIASGVTDMRKGFNGLNMLAQDALERDPPASRKWLIAASIASS